MPPRPATAVLPALLAASVAGADHPRERGPEPVVAYAIRDGASIPGSLTGIAGDAASGRLLFLDDARTGCALCHGDPETGAGRGTALPARPLGDVGARLSEGEIRLWIVAPAAVSPGVAMPGYYLAGQRDGADDPLHGGPRLSAAEIEDIVAFLATLPAAAAADPGPAAAALPAAGGAPMPE